MLEMLVYPVSAVMKFWHWLLAGLLGADSNAAWVASVFLLVISVRSLILPFAWQTIASTRRAFLMRAHLEEVQRKYGESTDVEDLRAEQDARKQIQKDHGYNPLAGCVPVFVQVPVFLGLYRLLQWMSVPDASAGRKIGVLSDAEIASFRDTTFFDVPLSAYVAMDESQFAFLGTTQEATLKVALPFVIMAAVFTSGNLLINQARNRTMLEWANTFTRRSYYFLYWFVPFVAVMLLLSGLTGPVPIALLMYWVGNNLFTTVQTVTLWALAVRTMPASDIHFEAQAAAREKYRTQRAEVKEHKSALLRLRASTLTNPTQAGRIHREIRDAKRARKQEKRDEKQRKKTLESERSAARRELALLRKKEREEQKASEQASEQD